MAGHPSSGWEETDPSTLIVSREKKRGTHDKVEKVKKRKIEMTALLDACKQSTSAPLKVRLQTLATPRKDSILKVEEQLLISSCIQKAKTGYADPQGNRKSKPMNIHITDRLGVLETTPLANLRGVGSWQIIYD